MLAIYKRELRSYFTTTIGYIFAAEAMAEYIPSPLAAWLDAPANPAQLPLLFGGMGLYALLTWLACRVSIKRFERVDL